jgi:hypothetical protein
VITVKAKVPVLSMYEGEISGYEALWRMTSMRLRGEKKFVNVHVNEVDDFEKRIAPGSSLNIIDQELIYSALIKSFEAARIADESTLLEVSSVLGHSNLSHLESVNGSQVAQAFVEWAGKQTKWARFSEAREWFLGKDARALWIRAFENDSYN